MKPLRVRRWRRLLLIAIGVAVLSELAGTAALALYWRRVSEGPTEERYATLAVLHADSPPALHRTRRALDRALELYREGRVGRILCIGGNRAAAGIRAGREMREYLIAGGVSQDDIRTETESFDTRTNVRAFAAALETSPVGRVAVVAYPAHQPRVRYYLRRNARTVDAALIAPRVAESPASITYEAWVGLNHEVVAWALTLLLSEQVYSDLLRRSRSESLP